MEVTDDEFPSLWQEISGALVRIAGQISAARKHEWQRSVDNFLKDPLTLEDEKNAQELDRWYKDDMEVKESIERLNSATNEVREVTEEVREVTEEVREGIQRLEKGSAQMHETLNRLSSPTASTQSAGVRLHMRVECAAIARPGTQREATTPVTTPQEPHAVFQGAATVSPISSNSQVTFQPTNFGNRNIPSEHDLLKSIAEKYLQRVNPSNKDEFHGFLQYLQEVRKVLFVDAQSGSLIITVECSSLLILDELWEDYYTGYLNEMAQRYLVTEDVLKEFGLTEVKLMTTITESEYRKCRLDFFRRSVELTEQFAHGELGSIPSGSIEIIIQMCRFGNYFALAVDSDDSVKNVKKKIQDKEGIPPVQNFILESYREILRGDGTLSDYNIHNGSVLYLIAYAAFLNIEIAIRMLTGRMITLTVTHKSTIRSVKTKIEQRKGIPSDQQCLVFGDMVLEDDGHLEEYEIEHKSILDLKEIVMEIFIKTLSEKIVELNVLPSDTIKMVKRKREKVEGFPPGKIPILAYDGRQLDDDATLAQHNIQKSSTLCEVASDEPASKNVLHFSHSFFLKIADKVLTAETAIQGLGFVGALAAMLYKEPEQVEKALRSVLEAPGIQVENITAGSILVTLRCCSRQRFLAFLLDFERKEAKERLESQMRGIGFKEELEVTITNREEVDETFDEIRTSCYKTNQEQELVDALEAHLPQEKTNICVELPTDKTISLELKSSDTIKMVKNKIEITEGIPAARQLLKLDGQELEDNRRLSYYGIQTKSTVELFESGMRIYVKTEIIDGEFRQFSLYVNPSDTLKSVKLKIQEKFGIPPDKQKLVTLFNSVLKDDLTLTHYNIQHRHRLFLYSRY